MRHGDSSGDSSVLSLPAQPQPSPWPCWGRNPPEASCQSHGETRKSPCDGLDCESSYTLWGAHTPCLSEPSERGGLQVAGGGLNTCLSLGELPQGRLFRVQRDRGPIPVQGDINCVGFTPKLTHLGSSSPPAAEDGMKPK